MATSSDKLGYTVDEAVTVTSFSRRRLYELMQDGTLRYARNGRRRIIPRSELEKLLNVEDAA